MDFAGDAARQVRQQIQRRAAEFIQRHAAAERRMLLLERKHRARIADAGARQRADRAGRNRVDADAARTEIGGEIAHRGFQRRLRHAHHIVIRHHPHRAAEGQGDHRAAGFGHQFGGALGDLGEGEAGNHHGARKILARGVGVAALQFVLVGEADGVDQKIQMPPFVAQRLEHRIDAGDVLDIAGQHQGTPSGCASGLTRLPSASP